MTDKPKHKKTFDLEERTLNFAKETARFCAKLPKNIINNEYIKQLIRSSGSVGANYREANDALSKKDFVHRVKITRKEAKESLYWFELIKDANPDYSEESDLWINEAGELKKIFSAIIDKCL